METSPATSASVEAHLTQSGTKRLRTRQACIPCHLLKAKCSGSLPSCQRCSRKNILCEYASSKPSSGTRKRRKPIASNEAKEAQSLISPLLSPVKAMTRTYCPRDLPPQRTRSDGLTSRGEPRSDGLNNDINEELRLDTSAVRPYIDAYFEHVAPLCENGFIHRAIFLRAWSAGKVNPALLKAICSASAPFMPEDPVSVTKRQEWSTEAEAHVWSNIGRPSMAILQVLVVLISQNCALSRFTALQPLLGIATKMAYLLRLNHENTQLSTTAREIRRRIMWSIFILDKRLAAGQSDLISCPKELMHIQLPSNERDFELAISNKTGALIPIPMGEGDSTSMGTRAYFCRLSQIRHDILQYTRRVISEGSKGHDSRTELLQLESDLQNLKQSLPESMAFSERNLSLRAFSPHLRRYVMLHTMWHQCHCDLFRFMLPGMRESLKLEAFKATLPDYIIYCQTRAVQHAKSLMDLFAAVQRIGDPTPQDPAISICVFQCTRILIRAFEIGLLGNHSIAIDILERLKFAAKILLPITAVNQSANQLHKESERLICATISGSPESYHEGQSNLIEKTSHTSRTRDNNILDILARIRRHDIEQGEEVLQQSPESLPATSPIELHVPPEKQIDTDNEQNITEGPLREDTEEYIWYSGFDSDHIFGSMDTLFDGLGGPSINLDPQDLEGFYNEQ